MGNSDSILARSLRGWEPGMVTISRRVDPWMAGAFAGLIGVDPPPLREGDPLPPMWHWFTLLEHPETTALGTDGHVEAGGLLPPIPGRRRMFAGGRLHLDRPIPIGSELTGTTSVTAVNVKHGRSGEMAFVTARTDLSADGELVGAEEQDIVYRSEPEGAEPRKLERPENTEPEPDGDWKLRLETDPVLLFRFSALTYNGHRIHYDKPYVTEAEGYPDLVIHGPLLALLALELPRQNAPERAVTSFEYRLVRPAFVPAPVIASAQPAAKDGAGTTEIAVAAEGVTPSLTAKVTLA